ncbi:MAG: dTDP-4-dehydrorhamnose 3,5-epimerase [Candidatus Korarchaeum sp.]
MPFVFLPLEIPDVVLIRARAFPDARGFFLETYRRSEFERHGIPVTFVQDNFSRSVRRGILRGLHYQKAPRAQGKLVMVLRGAIYDVAVDIRRGSPTYGRWVAVTLSEQEHTMLYVPPGFAHGFCVLSETADVLYKCTDVYSPKDERGIIWNASISLPSQVTHVLVPSDATIIGISTVPEEIGSEGDWIKLKFQTGSLWISYKFETSVLQPRPTLTSTSEVSASSTELGEMRSLNQSATTQESPVNTQYIIYLIPIILMIPALLLLSRRASPKSFPKGDQIEESILRELRERGGEITQADLTKALNLPRATVWRRLRRLEREGLVSLERRGNVTVVRLRR